MSLTARTAAAALLATVACIALVRGLADGTPLYAARAGRTCDNCHLTPNTWENPELALRKCSLACQTCHVDPAGGGLRNVAGRFYGRATLPLRATSPRPTMDWDRRWGGLFPRMDPATTYADSLPLGPDTEQDVPDFTPHDFWARGRAMGYVSQRYFQGRYGDLNADPMIRFGWDLRVALLVSQGTLAFPMQGDYELAFHPFERFTVMANVGSRGRTGGIQEVLDDPSTPYLREGFVLVHELPYQAYLKAGRFVPSYGLRLDDHTSFIRRQFDLDGSLPESRVTGVEIGAAPNYPFVSLSVFRANKTRVPSPFNIFDTGDGSGMALNLGYREVGWSVGSSFMTRDRPMGESTKATSVGVYGAFNPWYYKRSLPLTYQAEFDYGRADRPGGNTRATKMALYHELDWLAGNGLNILLKHDWEDPDTEVKDDEANRVSFGAQVTPVPGVTLDGRFRVLMPAGGQSGADFFMQLHLWN